MKTRSNVRKLSQDEIGEFLKSQKIGTLSMNDGEKQGHFLSFTRQVSPGKISISIPIFSAKPFQSGIHHLL